MSDEKKKETSEDVLDVICDVLDAALTSSSDSLGDILEGIASMFDN